MLQAENQALTRSPPALGSPAVDGGARGLLLLWRWWELVTLEDGLDGCCVKLEPSEEERGRGMTRRMGLLRLGQGGAPDTASPCTPRRTQPLTPTLSPVLGLGLGLACGGPWAPPCPLHPRSTAGLGGIPVGHLPGPSPVPCTSGGCGGCRHQDLGLGERITSCEKLPTRPHADSCHCALRGEPGRCGVTNARHPSHSTVPGSSRAPEAWWEPREATEYRSYNCGSSLSPQNPRGPEALSAMGPVSPP